MIKVFFLFLMLGILAFVLIEIMPPEIVPSVKYSLIIIPLLILENVILRSYKMTYGLFFVAFTVFSLTMAVALYFW